MCPPPPPSALYRKLKEIQCFNKEMDSHRGGDLSATRQNEKRSNAISLVWSQPNAHFFHNHTNLLNQTPSYRDVHEVLAGISNIYSLFRTHMPAINFRGLKT